jgi:heme/copper-type cytochrome/quinol oxidase subunit 2
VLLSLPLLGNLVSHQLSAYYHEKYRILYAGCTDDDMTLPDLKLWEYNDITFKLNWATTFTLVAGITMLVTFCPINAYQKNKYVKKNQTTNQPAGHTKRKDYFATVNSTIYITLKKLSTNGKRIIQKPASTPSAPIPKIERLGRTISQPPPPKNQKGNK